jgi:IS30 family transposase
MQQRLTFYEREQLELFVRQGVGWREMGRRLRRDHTVLLKEVRRNSSPFVSYTAAVAQRAAERKQATRTRRKLDKDSVLREHVETELRDGQSPDGIAGRLKKEPPAELRGRSVSHETIYAYIQQTNATTEFDDVPWYTMLFRAQPRRRPRGSRQVQTSKIPDRVSIHDRPAEVETRSTYGHWESDTLNGGRRQAAVSVQSERRSRLLRLHKLDDHTADQTLDALRASVESLPNWLFKTMTFDNGGEGAKHIVLRDEYAIQTYFADPYKSWQKGGVEQANGLLRRYLPKGMDLTNVTNYDLFLIQERLNNTYRKSLHYRTPNEMVGTLIHQGGALDS